MRCSKCGTEGITGKKFCAECGSPLSHRCSKCGSDNAPGAKFCVDCGAAFGARTAVAEIVSPPPPLSESRSQSVPEGERKTVTALFADIKGSTELEQNLDPEEARAIVDPALRLMIEAVRRYDGYIVQSTGDGIFALFGAPIAHEDHPQRALYAALRMQTEMRQYSARLVADGGDPLQSRIGINTGEVVVRTISIGGGQTEYTPIGHTANLASRMQAVAPVGSIAVTESTRKLCEGYFSLKPLGPTKLKGLDEPVNVYEVTGIGPLRTRLQRSVGHGLVKFVGREREMNVLRHAAELAQSGRGQIVAAVAEAGVGKSRLYYEFKLMKQSTWTVLEAFSLSHGKASSYLPLIELLSSYFKISDEHDARTRRERIAGRLAILDPSLEDARPYIFRLLGIADADSQVQQDWEQSLDRLDSYLKDVQRRDGLAQMDPQIRRQRTLDAIKRVLLRESRNQPLLLIFEDLHWIDEGTQAFLHLLADSIATSPILLLVNYRPEYTHQWSNRSYYTQIQLDPLGGESSDLLLDALLGEQASLIPLRKVIIEKTQGNPFFIEEIIQALVDEGSLRRNGGVHLTRALDSLKIPASVQGILAARIDRLRTEEKELLQMLAVVGKEFPLSLVRAAVLNTSSGSSDQKQERLDMMLNQLQASEFIYEKLGLADIEYTFKHALTQEVTYKSILNERRQLLHGRIGEAIETVYCNQIDEHLGELAHHFSRSSGGPKAIDYLWRAASQASQRSLYAETIDYVKRGLELNASLRGTAEGARDELRLQVLLGTASMAARGFAADEVESSFSKACELARGFDDPHELSFALVGLWGFYYTRGNAEAARRIAEESMRVARGTNDPSLLKYAHYTSGASFQMAGKLIEARNELEKALEVLNAPDPFQLHTYLGPDASVLCLTSLSDVLFSLGFPDQSLRRSHEALGAVKRENDPFSYAMAMASVVQAHCARREPDKGLEMSRLLIEICDKHGFPFWRAVAQRCLCWATTQLGRWKESIEMMNEQLKGSGDDDLYLNRFNILPLLAETYGRLGESETAFKCLEQWLEARNKLSITSGDKIYYHIRGELQLSSGSIVDAERSLREAIELSASDHAKVEQLRATTSLARLLRDIGRPKEARTILAEIYNWFTEGLDTPDLRIAKELLDGLHA